MATEVTPKLISPAGPGALWTGVDGGGSCRSHGSATPPRSPVPCSSVGVDRVGVAQIWNPPATSRTPPVM
ncbi:hypothetical protein DLJ53_16705 [Acuticoccus sediminis]|uniref:Uncharacterized protein n=1 Tax=Acuticoccus sediminis TaxID=2184697 RepID=A0A8B2NQC5_9HYPH|nr:hypothetical protein DLJ53_16705 [Acuticoccus sediminis]